MLKTRRGDRKPLPPLAGGEPELGERLLSDAQYMDSREAATAAKWVENWRKMPREEFDEAARSL
jgi:hypothetical protein